MTGILLRPFLFFATLAVAASGPGLTLADEATPTFDPADPAAIARAFYDPFNTGDTAIYGQILAPDWVDTPLAPGQALGRDGFPPVIAAFRAPFPDLEVVPQDVLVSGEYVTVRSVARGTHDGELFGIPPTGRTVEFMAIDVHRIADRQIVETWHVEDWLSVFGQLGVTYVAGP